ncbi:hypothetical protein RRG08_064523 [Elysia crispata]|uniref:Uncharacterized protein n=1 Tax=Elysia crispata TaxID=231223 RepID=A0AAE0XZ18_9GAST|nr:hypothetical protein RRG08_064523 [Elysia crispata]
MLSRSFNPPNIGSERGFCFTCNENQRTELTARGCDDFSNRNLSSENPVFKVHRVYIRDCCLKPIDFLVVVLSHGIGKEIECVSHQYEGEQNKSQEEQRLPALTWWCFTKYCRGLGREKPAGYWIISIKLEKHKSFLPQSKPCSIFIPPDDCWICFRLIKLQIFPKTRHERAKSAKSQF